MAKLFCYITKDLLPLYIDGVVSEDTAADVRSHLTQCERCRKEYAQLTKALELPSTPKVQEENSRALRRFKRRVNYRLRAAVSTTLLLLLLFSLAAYRFYIPNQGLFNPVACGHVEESEDWQTILFHPNDDIVLLATEETFTFDKILYERYVVALGGDDLTIQMRVLDTEGNVVLENLEFQTHKRVDLDGLKRNTPYTFQVRLGKAEQCIFNFG